MKEEGGREGAAHHVCYLLRVCAGWLLGAEGLERGRASRGERERVGAKERSEGSGERK